MGCQASIRGSLTMEQIPEFLWKYLDSSTKDDSCLTEKRPEN